MGAVGDSLRRKLSTVRTEYARSTQEALNEAEQTLTQLEDRDERRARRTASDDALREKYPALREGGK